MKKDMVLAIEPGIYWEGGGGLRLEDNFLITEDGREKLCSYPDDFRIEQEIRLTILKRWRRRLLSKCAKKRSSRWPAMS